ncbi:MFS transporter [Virgibacillus necropolis]|uniref:MFS transporter n=1 Tax=Virgibacillus necropolis TaxID=163877 RepID=A0A221MBG5_9BACI|nr:MFS transporter [Virgibacillus necropolis]ASN04950.1 MFS transporter [Virgibacillus necropolis]
MKFSRLVLPGVTMIAVTYGLGRFSFGLLLPAMNESLKMSEFVSGMISSLFYLAYCFTIILSTVITTKEGPRRMIILAGLSAFVGLLLMSITPNAWVLALGVLFAGGSTGLVSPPYGAAISLWIIENRQGKANTWINSGTSLGIVLSGVGAILLTPNWRLSYLIYAILAFLILIWNFRAIPKVGASSKIMFKKGNLSIRGVKGAIPLILASLILGISTAPFWTFSRSFIEVAGDYSDWQLSGFWVIIGIFGVLGGFSGSLIERRGLSFAYKLGSLAIALASIILSVTTGNWLMSYLSAGIFGCSYIFLTGVLLVWGIRVFITNASLGIGVPFLLLAVGQVIGSILAGWFIGTWGYVTSFILYGLVGMVATLIGPKKS